MRLADKRNFRGRSTRLTPAMWLFAAVALGCSSSSDEDSPPTDLDAAGDTAAGDGAALTNDLPSINPDVADVGATHDTSGELPSDFDQPCTQNVDCTSGWCVPSTEGFVCSNTCITECPTGWSCRGVVTSSESGTFVCFPDTAPLCRACAIDYQCQEGYCLTLGATRACTQPCDAATNSCPSGFECKSVTSEQDPALTSLQCIPLTGACDCSGKNDGEERPCLSQNDFGKCWGTEICDGTAGWTPCTASIPARDDCDGIDNDCDGLADEDSLTPAEPCAKTTSSGTCVGAWICGGTSGWECKVSDPGPEVCNYTDDDCDGQVDEPFLNTTTQKYDSVEACGVCGNNCTGLFPHAVPACDVATGQCVVDSCEPGFYKASPLACLPLKSSLCLPCETDASCTVPGDRCVALGEGSFCGRDCGDGALQGTECPDGYTCKDVGAASPQCVPTSGSCSCLPANDGLQKGCIVENAIGKCVGSTICSAGTGWSACSARTPEVEVCNGQDDDCDDLIDDMVTPPAAPCETQWTDPVSGEVSTCGGSWTCSAVSGVTDWQCNAKQAGPEYCDYQDNDCDGQTDDGFRDLATGKYGTTENCGACGYSCVGKLAHATPKCDASLPTPACVVAACDAGYYPFGAVTCLPITDPSCEPCLEDQNCSAPGSACLAVDTGRVCARDCSAGNLYGVAAGVCPDGYACSEDGNGGAHCLPATGSCTCRGAADAGKSRVCLSSNDYGSCVGQSVCEAAGWSPCTAGEPVVETCNGLDDDCDGKVDDFVANPSEPCAVTNTFGVCSGTWACTGAGGFVCDAKTPVEETCNYADDNCDGLADEPFRNGVGAYGNDDNCGYCGHVCTGTIPYATSTSCDAADGSPDCAATACAGGYQGPPALPVCLPIGGATDCSPCLNDAGCAALPGGRCEPLDQGKFCTRACGAGCPSGYDCVSGQCHPTTASCTCNAGVDGSTRSCAQASASGTCVGSQTCSAVTGWSTCTAATPQAEACNGLDDDCDTVIDDGVSHSPSTCQNTNANGTCPGTWMCGAGLGWQCNAPAPAAEVCNGADDDCDGSVDEGYRNPATGLYDSPEACGKCGLTCEGQIVGAATVACDGTKASPTCVVATCASGYFKANDYTCVPIKEALCVACSSDADCPVPGDKCLLLDGQQVCGADCSAGNLHGTPASVCPDGYTCRSVGAAKQCVPPSGSCTCLAANAGYTRGCTNSNPFGTCAGGQVCDPTAGWSTCTAAVPSPEVCNGVDDDCNTAVDDNLKVPETACEKSNALGTCKGSWACGDASGATQWMCNARAPAAEVCDSVDNDCDGLTDEDFRLAGTGDYITDDHCGSCEVSCIGAIAHATAACTRASGAAPRCEVLSCDSGYYQSGAFTCRAASDDTCQPCDPTAGCPTPGDRCVPLDGGFTCGRDCSSGNAHGLPEGACSEGFECAPLPGGAPQCIPVSRSCGCLAPNAGEARLCVIENSQGTCFGDEICDPTTGWSGCTAALPEPETCNGKDDNCNTAVDDLPGRGDTCAITNAFGVCSGVLNCAAGSPLLTCTGQTPKAEVCNGLDDDCDGKVDATATPPLCAKQLGVCAEKHATCGGSAGWLPCSGNEYGPSFQAVETSCDGVDNDCDGQTDEEIPPEPCEKQTGACAGTFKVCGGQAGYLACTPGDYGAKFEATETSCDYIDNDCDGLIDEAQTVGGKYTSDANCGVCGRSCVDAAPHGTSHCDASAATPVCVVTECEPGYTRVGDFQCVPTSLGLCAPCATAESCVLPGAICAPLVDGGFCANPCRNDADCPSAYACTTSGAAKYCLPKTNACTCTGTNTNLSRGCQASFTKPSGEQYDCFGTSKCTTTGWTSCAMPDESCNHIDDDCDGLTDEGFSDANGRFTADTDCGECGNDCTLLVFAGAAGSCNTFADPPVCSVTCDSNCFDLNANPNDGCECCDPGPVDVPDPAAKDANCDGIDGELNNAIFVSKAGSDTNVGSLARPMLTVQAGITAAKTRGLRDVYVATGVYTESVNLALGVSVYGGYSGDFRVRNATLYEVAIFGAAPTVARPGAINALDLVGGAAGGTLLDGVSVYGAAVKAAGASSYAIYVRQSDASLTISNCNVVAGRGGKGTRGGDGLDGANAAAGGLGRDALDLFQAYGIADHTCTSANWSPGGAGGKSTCGGTVTDGGAGGNRVCPGVDANGSPLPPVPSESGLAGVGGGAAGGTAGNDVFHQAFSCDGYSNFGPVEGTNGGDGPRGSDGVSGSACANATGGVTGGVWQPATGTAGLSGLAGRGGGGGGSGAGAWVHNSCFAKGFGYDNLGGSGGGGGAGACGGTGGTFGTGGGGAFGIFVVFTSAPASIPTLTGNKLLGGEGGDGGDGGNGGTGGAGGAGGQGGKGGGLYNPPEPSYPSFKGGKGGNGGGGGHGGGGGGGCGGPAVGIFVSGNGATSVAAWKTKNTFPQPGLGGVGGKGGFSLGQPGGDGQAGTNAGTNF